MAQSGESLNTLRDLHVLWVDCSEETNANTVKSPEYKDINGRLTTAMLTLQQHTQLMTDDTMESLGMPTRKELNSAYLQIHTLKKKVRKLESQVSSQGKQSDEAKINSLRDDVENLDIESLRKDVADLKKKLAAVAKTPASAAKKAPASRAKSTAAKAKPEAKTATKKGA